MKMHFVLLAGLIFSSCTEPNEDSLNSKYLKLAWKVDLKKIQGFQGFELPLIDGDRVYFPNGPDVECRNLYNGNLIWKANITGKERDYTGTNFMVNSSILVVNDIYSTSAFDKITGVRKWMAPDSGIHRSSGTMNTIDENFGYRKIHSDFIQFDLSTGLTIKEFDVDTGGVRSIMSNMNGVFGSTIATRYGEGGTEIYNFGELKKFDPITGNQVFSIRAVPRWFKDGGYGFYPQTITNLFAVPVLLDSVGYAVFRDGTVFKFRQSDGYLYWKYELPITKYRLDFPDAISVFPDEEKGLVFVTGGRDNWFCLDMETGKQLYWKRLSEYDGMIDPSSYDGNRYVFKPHTYGQYEWYIIDITTGEVVEEFDIPDDSILSQDVKNGYVAAFGVGSFYVFKIIR
ncbi:MAG: PQQ-binding-like beta-propeller repeat protein [Bacteroidetes bacterium]|nr:PQQ-binding-like beta-propeller repeat protein [Bacteroidota bacterium]